MPLDGPIIMVDQSKGIIFLFPILLEIINHMNIYKSKLNLTLFENYIHPKFHKK